MEKGFLATHRLMVKTMKTMILNWTKNCLAVCQGADFILGGFGGLLVGEGIAEKLEVPFVQAHVQPITPTSEFPGLLTFGSLRNAKGIVNRLSHSITRQVFWQPLRTAVNTARRDVLGLPPTRFLGNVGLLRKPRAAILYGYSPRLLPRPKDWDAGIHVTGYWFLDPDPSWSPPPALNKFLDSGPMPIAIGFGSMSSQDAEATARLVLDAAQQSGQRVVLISGWGGMDAANLPDWAFLIDSVPHSWLFPRTSLAVHHGGAGTTGAALRAGIPSVIVPFGADQPFWGWLLSSKGLGACPCPRNKLTAGKLAAAISQTLANSKVRERTAELGRCIRSEDGVREAVTVLEQVVGAGCG
jgi:UDP:flavonoid glycosyltransferase YjiC (YdhE family)